MKHTLQLTQSELQLMKLGQRSYKTEVAILKTEEKFLKIVSGPAQGEFINSMRLQTVLRRFCYDFSCIFVSSRAQNRFSSTLQKWRSTKISLNYEIRYLLDVIFD
jgi:hypothetical protein